MKINSIVGMNGTSHALLSMAGKTKMQDCSVEMSLNYKAQLSSSAVLLLK